MFSFLVMEEEEEEEGMVMGMGMGMKKGIMGVEEVVERKRNRDFISSFFLLFRNIFLLSYFHFFCLWTSLHFNYRLNHSSKSFVFFKHFLSFPFLFLISYYYTIPYPTNKQTVK